MDIRINSAKNNFEIGSANFGDRFGIGVTKKVNTICYGLFAIGCDVKILILCYCEVCWIRLWELPWAIYSNVQQLLTGCVDQFLALKISILYFCKDYVGGLFHNTKLLLTMYFQEAVQKLIPNCSQCGLQSTQRPLKGYLGNNKVLKSKSQRQH